MDRVAVLVADALHLTWRACSRYFSMKTAVAERGEPLRCWREVRAKGDLVVADAHVAPAAASAALMMTG